MLCQFDDSASNGAVPFVVPLAFLVEPGGSEMPLGLAQNALVPPLFAARVWPRVAGWHELRYDSGNDVASVWLDVQPADAWRTWRQAERRRATRARVALGPERLLPVAGVRTSAPMRPWHAARVVLFVVFLVAAGVLWLDERRTVSGSG